jgi:hypothetical protein
VGVSLLIRDRESIFLFKFDFGLFWRSFGGLEVMSWWKLIFQEDRTLPLNQIMNIIIKVNKDCITSAIFNNQLQLIPEKL